MIIDLDLGKNSYDIILERGILAKADRYLDLNRRVLIVTDDGVPSKYAEKIASLSKVPTVVTIPQGEGSKSFASLEALCRKMLEVGFTRTDCVVAVGGGVVGDLAGFAAASFMRGIDFYNIPTTLLSQVDSSIGGKVAINLDSIKNIVGAFHQPRRVLIDPDLLSTLPLRQIANGLAEAMKMGLTSNASLFELFEAEGDVLQNIDRIIELSLMVKREVVQKDECEKGLRRVLNFGHTIGHGIESEENGRLYHGECVALGMIPMCAPAIRNRVIDAIKRIGLPTSIDCDIDRVLSAIEHDKKLSGSDITAVYVDEVGSFRFEKLPLEELKKRVREAF